MPVTPAQMTASPAPKTRRWTWILGICAAFLVGIGLGAGTTQDRDASIDNAAATPTAPPETYTRTAPAPPPVTVTAPAPAPVTVTVTVTEEPPAPAGPGPTMGNGVHQVGVDVQPGRYKTEGPTGSMSMGMCFWSRNKDDSRNFDAIITNGIVEGPGSLTINAGEFVEISGDCTWTKVG